MADIFDFHVYDDRSIQFVLAEPIMLEDKDVTQFRFRIPKSLNGFDMTSWEWWFIFVNPKGTKYTTLLELTDDEDEPDDYSVATYTVGYGFSGIVGTVRFSIEALNVSGEEIVNEWHTKTYSTAVIDTLQGLRAVIPEPEGQSSTGITEGVKQALLQIARKVAYIDEHGQTYYNALYDALYAITAITVSPRSVSLSAIGQTSQLTAQTTPAGGTITWSTSNASVATVSANGLVTATGLGSATITATSGGKSGTCSVLVAEATLEDISAVYTPSGTVYESDSLDSLKSRLVVTAHWSNGTTSEVASADYTLSGILTTGTSTVTVSYGGMTTTFEVTVVGLTGITATYTQSGTVYDTASLDDLKSDLVVTANYSDGTSETVTDYTLSGTLTAGTSVVTVSYGGKTATFNVTVVDKYALPSGYTKYDYVTNSSTSNCYVDTGIAFTYCAPEYHHKIKFRVPAYPSSETQMYGARGDRYGGTWKTENLLSFGNTGILRMGYCGANNQNLYTASEDELIEFEQYHQSLTVNGNVVLTATGTGTYNTVVAPVCLFGFGWGTSAAAYVSTGMQFKIYEYSITDGNGDEVIHLQPCTNDNGQAGFYDFVSETFKTAATVASLSCGNDAS